MLLIIISLIALVIGMVLYENMYDDALPFMSIAIGVVGTVFLRFVLTDKSYGYGCELSEQT